ncbi:MAG: peptidyl-prolyl cis-trans isomerase [Gammaproteobacteria bacterium]|nr:peptidyl-prolyl cis-trans isomerase [Gammaproteobacteria bacterium]
MKVNLKTSMGEIVIELDPQRAPGTVANFLQYVDDGYYAGTIFHRVIDGFMVQGGGMEPGLVPRKTRGPIPNEANNGLSNESGTIAMARTSDPHSASAQFFINVKDNDFLDHVAPTAQGWGYCVFGRVVDGMDVVHAIRQVPTGSQRGMQDVPVADVLIVGAELVADEP